MKQIDNNGGFLFIISCRGIFNHVGTQRLPPIAHASGGLVNLHIFIFIFILVGE